MSTAALSSDVPTGRRMNGAEKLMGMRSSFHNFYRESFSPAYGEKVPKADEGAFGLHPSPALRFAPCLPLPAFAGRGTLDGRECRGLDRRPCSSSPLRRPRLVRGVPNM